MSRAKSHRHKISLTNNSSRSKHYTRVNNISSSKYNPHHHHHTSRYDTGSRSNPSSYSHHTSQHQSSYNQKPSAKTYQSPYPHSSSSSTTYSQKTNHVNINNIKLKKSRDPSTSSTYNSSTKNNALSTQQPSLFSNSSSTYPSTSSYPHPSTTSTRSSRSTKIIPSLPSLEFHEKPTASLQYEVSQSKPPNLNLSTYGYSVNARETTRHKALHDAIHREGLTSVKTRLSYLVEKYEKETPVMKILLDDYEWTDNYGHQMENRRKLEQERNKSRKKLYNRMQEKSKSKHYHRRR